MIIALLGLIALGVHFHIAFIKRKWYSNPRVINLEGHAGSKPEEKK